MNTFRLYNITAGLLLILGGLGSFFLISEVILRVEDYPDDLSQLNTPTETVTSPPPEVKEKDTVSLGSAMGLDVSHYQGDIDWENIDPEVTFVICKATQGVSFKDPMFATNWSRIKASGRIRGAYHFYVASDDPYLQAEFFWNLIKEEAYEDNDLPLVLDVEEASIGSTSVAPGRLERDVLTFLNTISELSGKLPIVYVDPSFANTYFKDSRLAKYPLWIAEYTEKDAPTIPNVWTNNGWDFWQRSAKYTEKGILGNVDHDLFDGDINDLKEFAANKNN